MSPPLIRRGSDHERTYQALLAAGAHGLRMRELRDALPAVPAGVIENQVYRLKVQGVVRRCPRSQAWIVDEQCAKPLIHAPLTKRSQLMELIDDCVAGISVATLAEELGLTSKQVHAQLRCDLNKGRVHKITLPAAHGGGDGYAKTPKAQARLRATALPVVGPAVLPAADDHSTAPALCDAALVAAPVAGAAAAAADLPARGRGEVSITPDGGWFIAWGEGFLVRLPRDVTREFFRYLDGRLEQQRLALASAGSAP